MWVLEIKSINDLTTAPLSPPSLSPGASSLPAPAGQPLAAFVRVLESSKVAKARLEPLSKELGSKWNRDRKAWPSEVSRATCL